MADGLTCLKLDAADTVVMQDRPIAMREPIPNRHKLAIALVGAGQVVTKVRQTIGHALPDIAPDRHVHVHNLAMSAAHAVHDVGTSYGPAAFSTVSRTFDGIVRDDGQVATRNHIGIIAGMNRSATICRLTDRPA
jgi:altronate hydrolase